MGYLEANTSSKMEELDDILKKMGHHCFLLIYMNGCGPCNETRPEWAKLKNVIDYTSGLTVATLEESNVSKLKNLKFNATSFPTMLYICDGQYDQYMGARSIDDFVSWISEKKGSKRKLKKGGSKSKKRRSYRRSTKKSKRKFKRNG